MGDKQQVTPAKDLDPPKPVVQPAPVIVQPGGNQVVAANQPQDKKPVVTPVLDEAGGGKAVKPPPPPAGPPAPPVGPPAPPPIDPALKAQQDAANRKKGEAIAAQLTDNMDWGLIKRRDPAAALKALEGQPPEVLRAAREAYAKAHPGESLERAIMDNFGGKDANAMMSHLYRGMDLKDKVQFVETGTSVTNLLATASPEEIKTLTTTPDGKPDRSILAGMKDKMSPDEYMNARIKLFPNERMAAVKERMDATKGFFSNDDGAAMTAFATLSIEERKQFLAQNGKSLGTAERRRLQQMASSEAEALKVRMRNATAGVGTDDDALKSIVADAGRLNKEEKDLKAAIANGTLSGAEKTKAEARLKELGDMAALLSPQRDKDGALVDKSFLGMMRNDVSAAEAAANMRAMGMPAREVSKQVILDAVGTFNDDEKGIREAFAAVPAGERKALWDDPDVRKALTENLNAKELAEVEAFRDNNLLEMNKKRIDDANGFFAQDEATVYKSVMEMSADDRAKFMASDLYKATRAQMDDAEKSALDEAMKTGHISLETGMKAASGGNWDGTNQDVMKLVSETKSPEEALQIRQGYVLAREGKPPSTPEEKAALEKFKRIEALHERELGTDDKQTQMDALLAMPAAKKDGVDPTAVERSTDDGRMVASKLMALRGIDKMGEDGKGGGGIASWFTDKDTTARESHIAAEASHQDAILDGKVSESELDDQTVKSRTFDKDYQSMIEAQNKITDTAALVAGTVAGIAATLATAGAAGPAVAAFMLQYGVVATAALTTATTIGTKELFGGDRYDATGADGAKDLAMGAVTAVTGAATNKLGDAVLGGLATKFPGVFAPALEGAGANILGQGAATTLKQQLPGLAVKNLTSNVAGGMLGTVSENLANEKFYTQSFGDMLTQLGGDMVTKGITDGLRDALIGTIVDGGTSVWTVKQTQGFMKNLEAGGVPPEHLTTMSVGDIRNLGLAQDAMNGGNLDLANKMIGQIKDLTPEQQAGLVQAMRNSTLDPTTAKGGPDATPTERITAPDAPVVEASPAVEPTRPKVEVDEAAPKVVTDVTEVQPAEVKAAPDAAPTKVAPDADTAKATGPEPEVAKTPWDGMTYDQKVDRALDELSQLHNSGSDPALTQWAENHLLGTQDVDTVLSMLRSHGADIDSVRQRVEGALPPHITESLTPDQLRSLDLARRAILKNGSQDDWTMAQMHVEDAIGNQYLHDQVLGHLAVDVHGPQEFAHQPQFQRDPKFIRDAIASGDPAVVAEAVPKAIAHFDQPGQEAAVTAIERLSGDPQAQLKLAQDLAIYHSLVERRPGLDLLHGSIDATNKVINDTELMSLVRAHNALSENLDGGMLRKLLPDMGAQDMLMMRRWNGKGYSSMREVALGGSIGDAANTHGLDPVSANQALGLDYKGSPFFDADGRPQTDAIAFIETAATPDLLADSKIPLQADLVKRLEEMRDDPAVAKFLESVVSSNHRNNQYDTPYSHDPHDPQTFTGGTASGPRNGDALPTLNQERTLDYKAGHKLKGGDGMYAMLPDGTQVKLADYHLQSIGVGSWQVNRGLTPEQFAQVKHLLPPDAVAAYEGQGRRK
ncbi:MAG: hypothetical protein KC621_22035 [Myxococcales bacterium]|nr:hypothetical protein [Myxococcales bacterium]